jgi:hypothetical protein
LFPILFVEIRLWKLDLPAPGPLKIQRPLSSSGPGTSKKWRCQSCSIND